MSAKKVIQIVRFVQFHLIDNYGSELGNNIILRKEKSNTQEF